MMASPLPSPEQTDPYAERRSCPRVPVALPAFIQAGGERHGAQLLDLSSGGAKVSCPASLPVGSTVTLDCGTLGREAVVRWHNGAVVGLCFKSALDDRDVWSLLERSEMLAARMKPRD
jgi:hypothetical protein